MLLIDIYFSILEGRETYWIRTLDEFIIVLIARLFRNAQFSNIN